MGSMQRGGFGGFCAHRCVPRGCRSLRSRRHEGYTQHSRGGAGLCRAGDCTSGGMMPTKVLFQNPAFMVLHVLGPHQHRGTFLLLAAFGRGTRGHNPPKMHQKCMGTDASMSPDLLQSTTPAVAGVSIQNTTTGRAVGDLEMETHGPERPVSLPRGGQSL